MQAMIHPPGTGVPRTVRWTTSSLLASLVLGCSVGLVLSYQGLIVYVKHHLVDTDPGNLFYLLWKRGLYPTMNPDHAMVAMERDPHREDAIRGLTLTHLQQRFGVVLPISQASGPVQQCAAKTLSAYPGLQNNLSPCGMGNGS